MTTTSRVKRHLSTLLVGLAGTLILSAALSGCAEPTETGPALTADPASSLETVEQAMVVCNPVNPPRYRGAPVTMNTFSHGGGYSFGHDEFWYPQWAGRAVHRYNSDGRFLGTFTTGRDHVMQIVGDEDGNQITAHWDRRNISKWEGRTDTEIWTTDVDDIVGGVAIDGDFVYAMAHQQPTVWKLRADTGELVETFSVPSMAGTLYGALAVSHGVLYIGRHHGTVFRVSLESREQIDSFEANVNIYNMSFDGKEMCFSPNSDSLFCYEICNDPLEPRAISQQVSTRVNTPISITLQGEDDNNRTLTFELLSRPQHGSLIGTAPNLTYEPINNFVGFDSFAFKVNNGIQDSPTVSVNIALLPDLEQPGQCDRLETPRYRGSPVTFNTRSHGGGYSPAFGEYWYPQWAGTTIHRYNRDHQFIGTFRTGRDHVMQAWGLEDGSYLTANWDRQTVGRWQGLSANLIWTTDLDVIVGGVTADRDFVYAMAHSAPTVWKLNKDDGAIIEQFNLPSMAGTLYGGLTLANGFLYVARHHGIVYVFDLEQRVQVDTFNAGTRIYNTSFDGLDMCFSPNSSDVFCHTICDDTTRPVANSQQISTPINTAIDITLTGSDPDDNDITYEIVTLTQHGSLTGTAPNMRYTPVNEFVGFDSFTFKVNNGERDSTTVGVNIAVLPRNEPPGECQIINPPQFRGGLVSMNTRSHGGGYSPAFNEYWYPAWAGTAIYRYDKDHRFLGTFNSGTDHMMQLHGNPDGTYLTANWDRRTVAKWQVLSGNFIWSTDLGTIVGGVTSDQSFVYAMDYRSPVLFKLNQETGALIERIDLPPMAGTLYGGLTLINDILYVGRHTGTVHRIDMETFEQIDTFSVDTSIYNMSFDGKDFCVSPNSDTMYCYATCDDDERPSALSQQISTPINTAIDITLTGSDPQDRDLTFTLVNRPEHGSLTGTAPNLRYSPVNEFVGFDSFTFKVNNGIKDSSSVRMNITVLPRSEPPGECDIVEEPRFRGGLISMNTRSHGGGFSPAFQEYWYPAWAGTTVYRYNRDHQFIGTFRTGFDHIMQLNGLSDGTYITANWDRRKIARWQGLSANLIWSTDLPEVVGGVTSDDNFVWAMAHQAPTLWKINKINGQLIETITLPTMTGTLYGGLTVVGNVLVVGRHTGRVYRINLENNEVINEFSVDTNIYNMSYDGNEYCVSPNSSSLFCYTLCENPSRPTSQNLQITTTINTATDVTLQGSDPNNLNLTFNIQERPEHGSLTGTAPNLRYEPINEFTGFDRFSFRVNNGTLSSPTYVVNITVLPRIQQPTECEVVNPPDFNGGLVTMNTRSHGGGYSPAFNEYWYPAWAGTTIYRYDRDHQFLGTFRTGRDHVMQLHGNPDGTYLTANWDRRKVAKWQGLSANLIWSTDLPEVVGGVAADENFVYAIAHQADTVWKLNKDNGQIVEEMPMPPMSGTVYGGLAVIDNVLYVGRNSGTVHRISLQTREQLDTFSVATNIYNMSFNGTDYCVSPNSSSLYCYTVCNDPGRPSALTQQVSTEANNSVDITLRGEDPEDRDLTFRIVNRPQHGSLIGDMPNLTYEPVTDFVGFDSFTFKVDNGVRESSTVEVGIAVLPENSGQRACSRVNPPTYRGAPVTMNTRSHGGGFNPAFNEYWYPQWSGTSIYRYDRDHRFLGTFNTGFDHVMQLWGNPDGTYLTANWDRRKVAKWQGLSASAIWSTDMTDVVGGVTEDGNFVYAMAHSAPTVWKLDKDTGALLETFSLPAMSGTLYGGLAISNGVLFVGRHTGTVHRFDLANRTLIDTFSVDANLYNMSFNGNEYCISPNNADLYCYEICRDPTRPVANSQQVNTNINTAADITLTGSDTGNRDLTFTLLTNPSRGALTGTAPNVRYTPEQDFVGFDSFTFKVNNGIQDSHAVRVNITVLPQQQDQGECELVNPPTYRGSSVTMNTRSHGGGYSPAYGEFWYPHWSSSTIYRYNNDLEPVGIFNSGRGSIMQLTGDIDGHYYTAHWSQRVVAKWQGLSSNAVWTTTVNDVVGGVAVDGDFVYAMAHSAPTVWKLNKSDGELVEQFSVPGMAGTLYGGLTLIDGVLYAARHHGLVYRINLQSRSLISTFTANTNIYNTSFDGNDLCFSPNSDRLFCYNVCSDSERPTATSNSVNTQLNTAVAIRLAGTDPQDRNLSFTILSNPEHGSLTGTAPNLTYTPITDYVGFDTITFKVNNGVKSSPPAQISISVLPEVPERGECEPVHPPTYRGSPITMNTRSHGGGFSPAFNEYWYPAWSGTAVYRYDRDRRFIGTFNSGLNTIMQLTGLSDGTYLTAHWSQRKVARWQGLSANALWITDVTDVVGGVTEAGDFVYAMAHSAPTVWKLNKETGQIVETFNVPVGGGTLYGGLAVINGVLNVGRHNGIVYRINLETRQLIDTFSVDANLYNMSFDGNEYCISPNNSLVYCYNTCRDSTQPIADGQQISTEVDTAITIRLRGTDPDNRQLTFTLVERPEHGSLTGEGALWRYTPINRFVGVDHFTFKVNNGVKDSQIARVNITVLPSVEEEVDCEEINPPRYRGAPVTMNTRSHGGGFSPAFQEYWYPGWSGTTIYRYNLDHQLVGTFRTGRGAAMQLWGERDGSYYTAHWSSRQVSKWQAMSANVIWTTDLGGVVGGVTSDNSFVYAMDYRAPTVWKLDKTDGRLLETITVPTIPGTLYGGLALVNGVLNIGRDNGNVYRVNLESRELVSTYSVATSVYSMSFNGQELCISPNTDSLYCYRTCSDPDQPIAVGGRVSTRVNEPVDITLEGTDPEDRDLTYTILTRPNRGSLFGTAPNLRYVPINEFVGFDNFTFKVNNGVKDSPAVRVNITVLPRVEDPGNCQPVDTPIYRGSPVTMNTRSHGGGFSPAFQEYWYPHWSGRTIYRYNKDHQQIGFFNSGRTAIMQLWGLDDGSYVTAHWSQRVVARWQGLSANIIWNTNLDAIVGGVTADQNFVYAMDYRAPTVWKLNKDDGRLLETITVPSMGGTLYGGLALIGGVLNVGRSDGVIYRVNLQTRELIDTVGVATSIYNLSFNGQELCVSPNTSSLYCYGICQDTTRPTALSQQFSTRINTGTDVTLTGTDPEDRDLTYTILERPLHGDLTGTAPNMRYIPVNGYVGTDHFTFKVNNGLRDSSPVTISIAILPIVDGPEVCEPFDTPQYRRAPVTMNTRSHGGGYSPAFGEYWYPHWSGATIYRYNRDNVQIGSFATGRGSIMQLYGDVDGSYYTAHWSGGQVSKWQAMSANAIWTTDLNVVVGGVAADENFVYAMDYRTATVYRLNKATGARVSQFDMTQISGTLYGGLAVFDGHLYVGRHDGIVYKVNLQTEETVSTFSVATNIYNMSFDGQDYCVSPNNSTMYCYAMCNDPDQPTANGQQVTVRTNNTANITLSGIDPNNGNLTYRLITTPQHGSLLGTAPNLRYEPILDFIGVDSFTFKVNNGTRDSRTVVVTISIIPDLDPLPACQLADEPTYRGRAADLNTRSHGGGYSPAFREYWYPNWSGTTVTRYDGNRQFIGTFRTGRDHVMQLWGALDGTYFTANWDRRTVARWQGLSANLMWSTDVGTTVGGVTEDGQFVWAMAHSAPTLWKLNRDDGTIIETRTLPSMGGTLYGGLAILDGDLLVGRSDRVVRRIDLDTNEIISTFQTAENLYNMSFNGVDYCVSANNSDLHCYAVCSNSQNRPPFIAEIRDQAHNEGQAVSVTLSAFDDDNDPISYSATGMPPGLSIARDTGTITGTIEDGAQENSPYTVTVTGSDGLAEGTRQFTWIVYDPNLDPPSINAREPGNVWVNGPFTVRGLVTDGDCENQPIVFIQGSNLTTTTTFIPDQGWRLETAEVSGAGIHNFGIRLRSVCSNLGAVDNVTIGVDTTAPTLAFTSGGGVLSQENVDQNDVSTWPRISGIGEIPMHALLRDEASGIRSAAATIVPIDVNDQDELVLDTDNTITIHNQSFEARNNTPLTGPLSQVAVYCSHDDHCEDNKLLVRSLINGSRYELRLAVTDQAGNATTTRYRFAMVDLSEAIRLWRTAVSNHTTEDQRVQDLLDAAVAKLNLALLGLDQSHHGNMFLALEDAGGLLAQARVFDRDFETTTQSLLVGNLATNFLDALLARTRRDVGEHGSFITSASFISRSRSTLALEGVDSARSAFLELANSYFWMEDGRQPLLVDTYQDAVTTMGHILSRMDRYIGNDPELPGRTAIGEARTELGEVMTYLQAVSESGPRSRSDLEHVRALLTITNAAESIKEAEETTSWVRQYQWGLTQIVFIFTTRGLNSVISFVGPNNPLVLRGQQSMAQAIEFRNQFRADDFMDLLINSRCLVLGLYNLVYDPDEEVPEVCCELTREFNQLDSRLPLPNHCRL